MRVMAAKSQRRQVLSRLSRVENAMSSNFTLSIFFLDLAFHGRRDRGVQRWPPSPLRVFQSIVAAAAARWRVNGLASQARSAMEWLELQEAPVLIAPSGIPATGYGLSVPNNVMDIVAKAWCRGNYSNSGDANPATHRTMKTVHPTYLKDGDVVHYLWPLSDPITDEVRGHIGVLCEIASSIVALGWGINMVVGHGEVLSEEKADALRGERWFPRSAAKDQGLRVPIKGTLDDLVSKYERFLIGWIPKAFLRHLHPCPDMRKWNIYA